MGVIGADQALVSPDFRASERLFAQLMPQKMEEMGHKAREFVRENFLLTRHLREYLTLMVALLNGAQGRIELG